MVWCACQSRVVIQGVREHGRISRGRVAVDRIHQRTSLSSPSGTWFPVVRINGDSVRQTKGTYRPVMRGRSALESGERFGDGIRSRVFASVREREAPDGELTSATGKIAERALAQDSRSPT